MYIRYIDSSLNRQWIQLICGSSRNQRPPAGVLHAILIVALCVLALYDSPELMSSSNFFQAARMYYWGITGGTEFVCVFFCCLMFLLFYWFDMSEINWYYSIFIISFPLLLSLCIWLTYYCISCLCDSSYELFFRGVVTSISYRDQGSFSVQIN